MKLRIHLINLIYAETRNHIEKEDIPQKYNVTAVICDKCGEKLELFWLSNTSTPELFDSNFLKNSY